MVGRAECTRGQRPHGGGFALDATVRIEGTDRAGRERLLRYCALLAKRAWIRYSSFATLGNTVPLHGRTVNLGAAAIEQTFDTIPGTAYVIEFDLAGNYGAGPVIKPLAVTINGVTTNYTFDTTGRGAPPAQATQPVPAGSGHQVWR